MIRRKINSDSLKKRTLQQAHLFAGCSRSFRHSLLGIDLREEAFSPNRASGFCVEQDFIPRYESIASVVIQGVKPGMDPELVTLWAVLGYPPVSIALPVWVKMEEEIPAIISGFCTKPERLLWVRWLFS